MESVGNTRNALEALIRNSEWKREFKKLRGR
jgi:hypothetical protein